MRCRIPTVIVFFQTTVTHYTAEVFHFPSHKTDDESVFSNVQACNISEFYTLLVHDILIIRARIYDLKIVQICKHL